jgi:glucosamine-6-phosphate deaminase
MTGTDKRPVCFQVDQLSVVVHPSRAALGAASARAVAEQMRRRLSRRGRIAMIFASAPSQNEFLEALAVEGDLDWQRVTAFQMDEYIGLAGDAPQNFGRFLAERLFDRVRPGSVHYLRSEASPAGEIERYGRLIEASPPDITCAGIGENGHLAFNDPPFADFADPVALKIVQLAEPSRQQQVHDGCFASIEEVPTAALTLTIPTLLSAAYFSCVVPGERKAEAVRQALLGPITTDCPASILRRHRCAVLHLDAESAARIPEIIP